MVKSLAFNGSGFRRVWFSTGLVFGSEIEGSFGEIEIHHRRGDPLDCSGASVTGL
jgi:hypothetical protein